MRGARRRGARTALRPRSGEAPAVPAAEPGGPVTTGTVVEVHGVLSTVAVDGRRYHAHLPRGVRSPDPEVRSPVVVGDRVEVEVLNQDQVRILRVEPRRNTLTRTDGFDPRKRHAIAANLDQVLLVVTPDQPPFRPRLIDRYLAAAAWDGLPAVICLNKIDLGVPEEVAWYLAGYRRIGYAVLQCSARTGEGMDRLREQIRGRTSLLTGHSGVGKSSILNAVEPGLNLRVGEVSAATGEGRHTTVTARLVPVLDGTAYVVDSPGIRAFGLGHLAPEDLAAVMFTEAEGAGACRFNDCLHEAEPGCAVRAAAERDPFVARRLASYHELLAEARQARGR